MILDTSAIVAAVAKEPDCVIYQNPMLSSDELAMSAITVLETRIVLQSRFGATLVSSFDVLLGNFDIIVVPFDSDQAQVAFDRFRRYGKGQGHPAQLNIIDCAAYALAKIREVPLLFKGNDFSRTDIKPAL